MINEMTDKEKQEFVFRVREDDEPIIEPWDRHVATKLAREQNLDLTDERWEVVSYLRKQFGAVGRLERARDMSVILDQRFKNQGGLKYVFTLFPGGPVTQGCRIAGIPVPADSTDSHFGTSV